MSDFVSDFWGFYIAALTIAGIAGCAALLKAMSTKRAAPGAKPELHGHVWDGDLAEYNNPLPRWWMWMFYLTIAFGVVYLVLYPGLGAFSGTLRWSSSVAYNDEKKSAEAQYAPLFDKYAQQELAQIAADPDARATGQRLFLNYCSQCHGSDGGGARGFPNLSDKDWLYGGDLQAIKTSIAEGRNGMMPPLGPALGEQGVNEVANYVLSLSGGKADETKIENGRKAFSTMCAACHGADAKGNPLLGAPNLTDRTWLYGGSLEKISETIAKGRMGRMPAHKEVLDEARIKLLAAYVHGLSEERK